MSAMRTMVLRPTLQTTSQPVQSCSEQHSRTLTLTKYACTQRAVTNHTSQSSPPLNIPPWITATTFVAISRSGSVGTILGPTRLILLRWIRDLRIWIKLMMFRTTARNLNLSRASNCIRSSVCYYCTATCCVTVGLNWEDDNWRVSSMMFEVRKQQYVAEKTKRGPNSSCKMCHKWKQIKLKN